MKIASPGTLHKAHIIPYSATVVTFWLTSFGAFLVYALSLPPHVTLGMGGAFSTGAWYASVAQPPGFPVWTIFANAFSVLLPVGNVAWRVALFSAITGCLMAGVLATCIHRAGDAMFQAARFQRLPTRDEQYLKITCSFVGASALAFSSPMWELAVAPEPHAFSLLLLCLAWACFQRWFFAPDRFNALVLAITVYGMAVVNSLSLFVAAPGLLLMLALRNAPLARDFSLVISGVIVSGIIGDWLGGWPPVPIASLAQSHNLRNIYLLAALYTFLLTVVLTIRNRRLLSEWRKALLLAAAFSVPFLSYFFFVAASMTNPPIDSGYARSYEGFVHLIGRGQFEAIRPVGSFYDLWKQIGMGAPAFFKGYGWTFSIPAGLCLMLLPKLNPPARTWLFGMLAPFICLTLVLVAILNPPADPSALELAVPYATPAYLILSIWTGVGLMLVGTRLARRRMLP